MNLTWIGIDEDLWGTEEQKAALCGFCARMEAAGIRTLVCSEASCGQMPPKEEGLILAGDNAGWKKELSRQMAVIAYDNRTGATDGIPYVIESFDGIDIDDIQLVYCRYHRIPVRIANTRRGYLQELTIEDIRVLWTMGITLHQDRVGNSGADLLEEELAYAGADLPEEELAYAGAYLESMYSFYEYGMWGFFQSDGKKALQQGALQQGAEEQALLGMAGFDHIDPDDLPEGSATRTCAGSCFCLQAGYHIGDSYRRCGYGLEALLAVTEYGRKKLGAEQIMLFIEEGNTASEGLALKAGYRLFECTQYRGKVVKVYIMNGVAI